MKRNIVIATVAAAALIGGGTATTFALSGDGEGSSASSARKSSVQLKDDGGARGTEVRGDDRYDDDRYDDDTDDRDDRDYRDDRDDRDEDARDAAEAKAAKVSAADAIAAALRSASGTAVSAELDSDDGGLVWDVDVLGKDGSTWHSVHVDPGTGKVLGSHTEKDAEDGAEAEAALKGSSVSAADAAKAAAGKGTVTSVDLEDEARGKGAWEVETVSAKGAETHWLVDLSSAKVTPGPLDD
ncbi:PepSY domain-containing protein [Streptomyces sp. NPDC053474]|uniref:PepSY domain-containing protein n=1 Tax=Streptomyces sp. NPDC053474 TaxID=3365704 RepID=UPI0037CE5B3A